ncbi:PREDICTED: uncharacterized protein LOC106125103 [Papilio xuthus]|uniref:Uncharacterized protein LOC106125103 n=2 Tax=Papilio xuthus TaxID=66420 RepID=A0AAJ6ZR30_PAPXU|nr:PREDICTED: uncharacterized protein LOC106125103 [Papilio xuthus]
MTMDVQNNFQNYKEPSPDAKETNFNVESARSTQISKSEMQTTVLNQNKTSKRSFDVAFLMMPDDKVRQKQPERQLRVSKQLFSTEEWEQPAKRATEVYKHHDLSIDVLDDKEQDEDRVRINNNISPGFGSDINIDVGTDEYPSKSTYFSDSDTSERSRSRPNSNESAARPKFLPEYKSKIFDDPTLISMQTRARYDNRFGEKSQDMSPKSAFTKVSNFTVRSPNPSVSPDNLHYQNSISPPLSASSPPANAFNKANAFTNLISPAHLLNGNSFFKGHNVPSSSPNYPESSMLPQRTQNFKGMEYQGKQPEPKTSQISPNKMNFLPFRPEIPYLQAGSSYPFGVQNFQQPNADFMKFPVSPRESVSPLIANPAAAILSTLLPPTLAAFSLPAQNVCAKCSISFRMTSDLVYHMRTHHKSETTSDPNRRKREEKLKCPVCNESFRERHHLTRHMTAHQDKEGDMDDVSPANYNKKAKQFYPHNGSVLK